MRTRKKRSYGERLRQYLRWVSVVRNALLEIRQLEANAERRIARITEVRDREIAAARARILARAPKILGFFESQRAHLRTSRSGTTVRSIAGSMQQKAGAYSIEVTDGEAAIAELERRGIEDALRREVKLDKKYLLKHPELVEEIPGISREKTPKILLCFEGIDARLERSAKHTGWDIIVPKEEK